MTLDVILVNGSVTLSFLAGMTRNHYVAKGQLYPVYWLMIVMGLANTVLNCAVAWEKPAYAGLYLFNILTIHSIISAIRGLRRLANE
jgi:hypothetical protein